MTTLSSFCFFVFCFIFCSYYDSHSFFVFSLYFAHPRVKGRHQLLGKPSQCGLQLAAPPPPLAFLCLSLPQSFSLQLHLQLQHLNPSSYPFVHLSVCLSVFLKLRSCCQKDSGDAPGGARDYRVLRSIILHICTLIWKSSSEMVMVRAGPWYMVLV